MYIAGGAAYLTVSFARIAVFMSFLILPSNGEEASAVVDDIRLWRLLNRRRHREQIDDRTALLAAITEMLRGMIGGLNAAKNLC